MSRENELLAAARRLIPALAAIACVSASPQAAARIARIVVTERISPAFAGGSFGSVGQYEVLLGTAYGEVDPAQSDNAIITDIQLAPRNARGAVEYSMPFYIVKPLDPAKGNRTILFDVLNRGRALPAAAYSRAVGAEGGFKESQGWTEVGSAWEADLDAGAMRISIPVAHSQTGAAITGTVHGSWEPSVATATESLPYEAVGTDKSGTPVLQRKVHAADPPTTVPGSDWAFADCSTAPFPGVPSTAKICVKGGFDTDHIWDLFYTAKNPTVMGLGFAATRDFVAFLRTEKADDEGTPNPLAGTIDRAIAEGVSQSGRYLRTFLHLGFNKDERGRRVFDGMHVIIAPMQIALNIRFAQPTSIGLQHEEHDFPIADAPHSWDVRPDPVAGYSDGILRRCQESDTCPKIISSFTSTEYWQYRAALDTTDGLGHDLDSIPENVRMYYLAGGSHSVGGSSPACQLPGDPNFWTYTNRALTVRLQEWVQSNRRPPDSRYPLVRDRTLTKPDARSIGWPGIPGVTYNGVVDEFTILDRGPQYIARDMSGIMAEPAKPIVGKSYRVLVPKVNRDGNEVAGIHDVDEQAPLGTYMGWGLRKAGYGEGDLCNLQGGFAPFKATKAERVATRDPRPSLEERYGTRQGYACRVKSAAEDLVRQGLLLPDDALLEIARAETSRALPAEGSGENAETAKRLCAPRTMARHTAEPR